MDFGLDKKHEMARSLFREFAENEVKPLAQEVDETEEFPVETVKKMQKLGFLGIPVPKEYGGQGCDPLTYVMCVEELSKVCGTTGVIVSAHTSLCIDPILTYGTDAQKEKYVRPLASGEKLGAFALTEPGAGTDAQGAQTKAVLDGDEWVLNGSKCFITNGKVADVYIVIAITSVVTDKRGRKKKNFSAFIVDKGAPGFSFGTKEKKMGIRGSSTYELIFEDCRIPKENLLGPEGKGFPIAMHTLDGGRIGIAAQALGIAEGALDRAVAYTKERKQFGRSIAPEHPVQTGGYGCKDRSRTAFGLQSGDGKSNPEGIFRRSGKGKIICGRNGYGSDDRGRTAVRRIRVYQGVRRRTYDARCEDHRNLRRYFRGSEDGNFRRIVKIGAVPSDLGTADI